LIAADAYFADDDPTLQQGDIVLAPIGRFELAAGSAQPSPWTGALDEVTDGLTQIDSELPELQVTHGYALAIVTSHDCQMVKELERRYHRHRKEGMSKEDAIAAAEADQDLDRFVCVSPIIPLDGLRQDRTAIFDAGVIGYFPVHEKADTGVFEGAADLTYRATVDRHAIVTRAAVLSEEARTRLRYELARVDALRSPKFAFSLEEIIGERIVDIRQESENPLGVEIELKSGERLHLLMQPDPVDPSGPAHAVAPRS
jgi:hypothetical protein